MKSFYEMLQLMEADGQGLGDQTGQEAPTSGPDMPSASAGAEAEMEVSPTTGSELKNYMFFSNLKAIKERVERMLSMDPAQVDAMISDGHDWASDHIATSKDDVEEVCNWLAGEMDMVGAPAVPSEASPEEAEPAA